MATRFEIALYGDDPVALRSAAEEALDEIQRLESKLSLYRPDSEIAHVNARAAEEPVRVSPELFRLLEQTRQLHEETEGAFNITVGPLMRAWGFVGDSGHLPDPQILEQARQCVGMNHLHLDADRQSVRFLRRGVMVDLGSIGKGYAIEKAAEILRETGVSSALIHGGTSTTFAIGAPPGEEAWKIAIERPPHPGPLDEHPLTLALSPKGERERQAVSGKPPAETTTPAMPLAIVSLREMALSVSGVSGKSFQIGGSTYGHVIDPRTGAPASAAILAAVCAASATESDALSTALLTLGVVGHQKISALRSGMRTMVVEQPRSSGESLQIHSSGIEILNRL